MSAATQAGSLLAVSQSLARDMAGMGMDAGKIAVHYTGCDLALFRPRDRTVAKAELRVTGPLVVSLGALISRKGHDLVIDAMTEIKEATLLLVGVMSQDARTGGEGLARAGSSLTLLVVAMVAIVLFTTGVGLIGITWALSVAGIA